MNVAKLKEHLLSGFTVTYNKSGYKVNAIIYRKVKEKICLQAELSDKCGHSVIIADAGKVDEYVEKSNS